MSSETASTRWTRERIVSLTKGVGWPLSKTGIHTTKDFGMNYQGKKRLKPDMRRSRQRSMTVPWVEGSTPLHGFHQPVLKTRLGLLPLKSCLPLKGQRMFSTSQSHKKGIVLHEERLSYINWMQCVILDQTNQL